MMMDDFGNSLWNYWAADLRCWMNADYCMCAYGFNPFIGRRVLLAQAVDV